MNIDPDEPSEWHLDALLAAARAHKSDISCLEYGFETRLMAKIATQVPMPSLWWAAWTWRLAPLFAVMALSLSLWTRFSPRVVPSDDQVKSVLDWSASSEDDFGVLIVEDFLSPS